MQNRYDLVIYGATGFTGSIAVKNLMQSNLNGMRVAIAGRDANKLTQLQQGCEVKPDIIIADSTNVASIEAMVKSTKSILNFAGPFAKYAEPVISACATYGTNYLDITGEAVFIRQMMDKYQEQAKQSGARLIPFCGFDSVPADLTTFLAVEAASANGIKLDDLSLYYQIKGGYNGGTLESVLNMGDNHSLDAMSDSNILISDSTWPKEKKDQSSPRYEPDFSRWSSSFFMAPINKAVVRCSAYMRSKADFHYEERLLMPKEYGCAKAYMTNGFLAGFALLCKTATGRNLVRKYGLQPGQGPSEEARKSGYVRMQLIGRSNGEDKIKISMERQGDPGNEVTVALANECARLAVENQFVTEEKGFLTPSVAFGHRLYERLQTAGFKFQTEIVGAEPEQAPTLR